MKRIQQNRHQIQRTKVNRRCNNIPRTLKTQTSSREERRLNGQTAMPKVNGSSLILINTTLAGSEDRKIEAMTTIIYNVGMDRFGIEEGKKPRIDGEKNRREREIAKMRRDLSQLSKQYKKATEVEKTALSDLRDNIREQLKVARRAERSRRRRKERDRAKSRFTSDPFQFTSRLLGSKGSGMLKASKEEVQFQIS